ncbi:hypothetical protein EV121DRAFT_296530 [Schizophyllum commune]
MSKDITLKAFNGLPGVSIGNFELPSDDPDGGIHMESTSSSRRLLSWVSTLARCRSKSLYKHVNVGPLSGQGLILAPQSATTKHMTGRFTPKSDDELDTIGDLFMRYLQAENISLTAQGDTVMPDGSSEIEWLSDAFKTLELEVTLLGESFDIIQSISIDDLEVTMESDDQTWVKPAARTSKSSSVSAITPLVTVVRADGPVFAAESSTAAGFTSASAATTIRESKFADMLAREPCARSSAGSSAASSAGSSSQEGPSLSSTPGSSFAGVLNDF